MHADFFCMDFLSLQSVSFLRKVYKSWLRREGRSSWNSPYWCSLTIILFLYILFGRVEPQNNWFPSSLKWVPMLLTKKKKNEWFFDCIQRRSNPQFMQKFYNILQLRLVFSAQFSWTGGLKWSVFEKENKIKKKKEASWLPKGLYLW